MAKLSLPGAQRRLRSAIEHVLAGTAIYPGAGGTIYSDYKGGRDFDSTITEALERNIWVFRSVDAIASNQARLPMLVRQGDMQDGRESKDFPELVKLLNRRPNSYEDAFQFRYRLSAQALLSKRGVFIEPVRDMMGRIKELHLIPPDVIEPIPDEKTFISGFRVRDKYKWNMDEIPPDKIVWIRLRPHPQDPYAQMTPLMAAGLAVETDYMARLYNRNYLHAGGKNGLLVAVQGLMGATDAEEMKMRFRGGPGQAGIPTVIEAGSVTVNDLGATPRDAQWLEAITGSKEDVMMAFGVAESVIGNASGRTFDNADAEWEGFWTATEMTHCDGLARGMDPLTGDVHDDNFVAYDYSSVDVLQRQKRNKDEKVRQEFLDGLITWDEYREATGKKVWNVPWSRAAYLAAGKVPITKSAEDIKALTESGLAPIGSPPAPDPGALMKQGQEMGQQVAQRRFDNELSARTFGMMKPRQALGSGADGPTGGGFARSPFGYKAHPDQPGLLDAHVLDPGEHPYDTERKTIEAEIGALIDFWNDQQERILPERVTHAKVLKHTRHWTDTKGTGEGVGTKALDPKYIVEVARWSDDLGASMRKMLDRVSEREVARATRDMDSSAFIKLMAQQGLGHPAGTTATAKVFGTKAAMDQDIAAITGPLEKVVRDAAARQSARVIDKITEMDATGATAAEIKAEIKKMTGDRSSWKNQLKTFLTTSVVEGIRYKTYGHAGDLLKKSWATQGDEKVRHTHEDADAQTKNLADPFLVGGAPLFYPGDPLGPLKETINCRCWTEYEIADNYASLYDDMADL